ncbi:Histidine phosphatase superfamily clade-1 [Penicillium riverlandense]|uniref:Histidine phosphatase superfamily clade-1 n=1 Tax=Penicillium riverlandense TaxID=1903569 RepID=UPI0025469165|nr:Histidine phosphatase superfamily clade-1 [Penicillium riverlandense]KAJ5814512.1 Histidine phosphatase superfamily clade-1 [Penicillium riverlandense]
MPLSSSFQDIICKSTSLLYSSTSQLSAAEETFFAMDKSPPIVFIARHGARLDAADKDWHLTSPTPYDPPLSYGGWIQSRALGARIASLLQAREFTGVEPSGSPPTSAQSTSKPVPSPSALSHRYRIVIHTSPYLRCLQTAIALSAGIHQHRPGGDTPGVTSPTPGPAETIPVSPRCLLRVDAVLGEWLSPDYFEHITPPPSSERMVAAAKAELLRRGEGITAAVDRSARSSSGHFPGGWSNHSNPISPASDDDGHRLTGHGASQSLSQQGPRQRASTYDTLRSPIETARGKSTLSRINTDLSPSVDGGYVPPTPGYAVSASDPIPIGYVTHARDACTQIDYQWDSMRPPQSWGTGGEYGEEWSTMHERVHAGFKRMVDWYPEHPPSASNLSHYSQSTHDVQAQPEPQTVLVIVTHGADCNALISSLSGHSAFLDIGTASLTMAVRRDRGVDRPSSTSDSASDSSSRPRKDGSVAQEYVLQLMASTDHLPSTLATSDSDISQPSGLPPIPLPGAFTIGSTGSASSPRGWALASHPLTGPRGASGLWGSISSPADKVDDTEDDFVPNFGDPRTASQGSHGSELTGDSRWAQQLPQRTLSQRGLWGSAPALEDRDTGMKRRWTVAEQKL